MRWRRCAPAFAWRLGFRRTVTEVAQPRCAARAQRPHCRQRRRCLTYSALAAMACWCAAAKLRNWMCATPPAAAAKPRNWMCAAPPARTPSVFSSVVRKYIQVLGVREFVFCLGVRDFFYCLGALFLCLGAREAPF